MSKYQHQYRIPSARALWHSYDSGCYFVTICTAGKLHYFGQIENAEMQLNELGRFVAENLQDIATHYPYAEIPLFVVMPNHIHLIIWINDKMNDRCIRRDAINGVSTTNTNKNIGGITGNKNPMLSNCLGAVIRGIKARVTHYANKQHIPFAWQTRFHDRIIRNHEECNRIAEYIENNPALWNTDEYR